MAKQWCLGQQRAWLSMPVYPYVRLQGPLGCWTELPNQNLTVQMNETSGAWEEKPKEDRENEKSK